jgi:NAD(P)-dependent dehydrogenase (short-subunit alcohol dehydrogenase family)
MPSWNTNLIPDQTGQSIIITGASSGLGLCCAETLAARGASVILAVRDTAKGAAVADAIRAKHTRAQLTVSALDLASLASVAAFARQINDTAPRIDVLLNNAGLGMQPTRITTQDGFEQQFGTNHLGHFALTAHLVPALLRAAAPRVVTVASIAHRRGRILWDDPNQTTAYDGRRAYTQSKLANLMFALELASRVTAQGSRLASIAAHPGLSLTGFIAATQMPAYKQFVGIVASKLIGQSAQAGAAPLLYAAAMPDARNGAYWGPDGVLEIRGLPARGKAWPHALVQADRARLWALSEALTGVTFPPLK